MSAPDSRAVRILLDFYWSSDGWRATPSLSPEDHDHAVTAGIMRANSASASHDEVVHGVLDSLKGVSVEDAASCFMASLGSRRLDLRSALSSVVLARRLELHDFVEGPSHISGACAVCGVADIEVDVDWNVMNFERFKWGGVRHDDLTYVWLDLQQFATVDRPEPSAADRAAFEQLLEGLEAADARTTAAKAAGQRWPGIPSNKAERQMVLEMLGICSILRSPEHTGHLDRWVPAADRVLPDLAHMERAYPVCWWRAEFGVNRAAAQSLNLL